MTRAPDCDLHSYFRDPDRARGILDACISDCVKKNIPLVRVIHGKGDGHFRALIQSHLKKHPDVEGFVPCDPLHGGSGATWTHIMVENVNQSDVVEPWLVEIASVAKLPRPFNPWIRRLLLLILLAASFVVFPQWIARAGMVFLVAYMEFRLSQPDYND